MIQSLQHRELGIGQIADRVSFCKPRQQGIRTAGQFDEGIQGAHLCGGTGEMGGHQQLI